MADPKSFDVKPGDEVELTYRLDYKSAEVKRLPDAAMYTHVTTRIEDTEGTLPWRAAQYFSRTEETVKVTEDDQLITFVARVTSATWDDGSAFPVTARYGNGTQSAPGETPHPVAVLAVRKAAT
jgi:hypothetical protein